MDTRCQMLVKQEEPKKRNETQNEYRGSSIEQREKEAAGE